MLLGFHITLQCKMITINKVHVLPLLYIILDMFVELSYHKVFDHCHFSFHPNSNILLCINIFFAILKHE